ncbi:DUF3108 domain-containing protein [Noviherbaspirillum massiliense]|uniref:DUF3108 domain-containing protein n=1 Tax=Noviherbaspirillum massiliense TaxID=1465823 RepID=UPI0003067861|nr:DUF3108 domain-containing protein [Noviherbaspirillum massiliense]
MPKLRITSAFATSIACSLILATAALGANRSAPRQKFNVPPSADLTYSIKAHQGGIAAQGQAIVRWTASGDEFSVNTEARAMLVGKILETSSHGLIDQYGLAPLSFTEKRFRKHPTTTSFDRTTKTISFTESAQTYPIKGGEQDRSSVVWQLVSIARAAPARMKPNSEWKFFVAGRRDAEPWTFKVVNQEKIKTGVGTLDAVHILRAPPPDSQSQKLDIWLAPSLDWYPVRLRFTDADDEFIEQTLENVNRKAS